MIAWVLVMTFLIPVQHGYALAYSPQTHLVWHNGWHLIAWDGKALQHHRLFTTTTTPKDPIDAGMGVEATSTARGLELIYPDPNYERLMWTCQGSSKPIVQTRASFRAQVPVFAVHERTACLIYRSTNADGTFSVWKLTKNGEEEVSNDTMRKDSGAGTSGIPVWHDGWHTITIGAKTLYLDQLPLVHDFSGVHDAHVEGDWLVYRATDQQLHLLNWVTGENRQVGPTLIHTAALASDGKRLGCLTAETTGLWLHWFDDAGHSHGRQRITSTTQAPYWWCTLAAHDGEWVVAWMDQIGQSPAIRGCLLIPPHD